MRAVVTSIAFGLVVSVMLPAVGKAQKQGAWDQHPRGDTALERITILAHTDALPKCDRIEILAISMGNENAEAAKDGGETPGADASPQRFPVKPYRKEATIHKSKIVVGAAAETIHKTWRALEFSPGGALCHMPVYGLRFFRDDQLIFETSVCWKCHNFYVPDIESVSAENKVGARWYGFERNATAMRLLKILRKHLPHPVLDEDSALLKK